MSIRTLALFASTALVLGLVSAACADDEEDVTTPTSTPSPTAATTTPTPDPEPATEAAIEALGTWLGPVADPSAISVVSVEAVTWPNGCLGLDRVGQACTEALVEGFRIELALGEATYEVRTDLTGDKVLWAPETQILVMFEEAVTNLIAFTTDDGGTLETQPVSGTEYGVEPDSLSPGDPVSVGLADAPQREGHLLVWLDPAEE